MGGPRIQAVILDLDDTLFDHRESARRGVRRLVEELGAKATPKVVESWESTAESLMSRWRAGEFDRTGYRHSRVRGLLADIGLDAEASSLEGPECDRIYDRFIGLYEEEWVGFSDVLPTLAALDKRGLPVAVLTNGPEERQQRKARKLGIASSLSGVWTSERIGARKPAAESYLTVCEALEVAPRDVLHVGDNMEFDLHGAVAAGLQGLHLDRSQESPVTSQRITSLGELLSLL